MRKSGQEHFIPPMIAGGRHFRCNLQLLRSEAIAVADAAQCACFKGIVRLMSAGIAETGEGRLSRDFGWVREDPSQLMAAGDDHQ